MASSKLCETGRPKHPGSSPTKHSKAFAARDDSHVPARMSGTMPRPLQRYASLTPTSSSKRPMDTHSFSKASYAPDGKTVTYSTVPKVAPHRPPRGVKAAEAAVRSKTAAAATTTTVGGSPKVPAAVRRQSKPVVPPLSFPSSALEWPRQGRRGATPTAIAARYHAFTTSYTSGGVPAAPSPSYSYQQRLRRDMLDSGRGFPAAAAGQRKSPTPTAFTRAETAPVPTPAPPATAAAAAGASTTAAAAATPAGNGGVPEPPKSPASPLSPSSLLSPPSADAAAAPRQPSASSPAPAPQQPPAGGAFSSPPAQGGEREAVRASSEPLTSRIDIDALHESLEREREQLQRSKEQGQKAEAEMAREWEGLKEALASKDAAVHDLYVHLRTALGLLNRAGVPLAGTRLDGFRLQDYAGLASPTAEEDEEEAQLAAAAAAAAAAAEAPFAIEEDEEEEAVPRAHSCPADLMSPDEDGFRRQTVHIPHEFRTDFSTSGQSLVGSFAGVVESDTESEEEVPAVPTLVLDDIGAAAMASPLPTGQQCDYELSPETARQHIASPEHTAPVHVSPEPASPEPASPEHTSPEHTSPEHTVSAEPVLSPPSPPSPVHTPQDEALQTSDEKRRVVEYVTREMAHSKQEELSKLDDELDLLLGMTQLSDDGDGNSPKSTSMRSESSQPNS
eukprot:Rhum_TRINITY_DN3542_c0_g1::Rhum_TRINITY_DN3542_c0_g1_i1::g.11082::m.11082